MKLKDFFVIDEEYKNDYRAFYKSNKVIKKISRITTLVAVIMFAIDLIFYFYVTENQIVRFYRYPFPFVAFLTLLFLYYCICDFIYHKKSHKMPPIFWKFLLGLAVVIKWIFLYKGIVIYL